MLLCLFLAVFTACQKPEVYTVVVSMDGFRWDYPDVCETPQLNAIANDGVRCAMEPSYPASTFPNHYTIATGLVPDHHGIVNNKFWNPDTQMTFTMSDSATRFNPAYFLGEPIWVTAESQGVKTASVYWVGSDVAVKNTFPTYGYAWNDEPRLTFTERVDEVVRLLSLPEEERPRLTMLYFEEPDMSSHHCGPLAPETKAVVHQLDSLAGVLYSRLKALPHGDRINIVFTADHGMTEVSDDRFICWEDYLNPSWYEHIVGASPTNIHAKPGCEDSILTALAGVEHIQVWRHGEMPEELNYGTSNRTGDIIVAPELGWQFSDKPKGVPGAHGYSPKERDMQVSFIAAGPSFKTGLRTTDALFRNVDIYPLLAHLLGIRPAATDGNLERISKAVVR